MKRILCYGDSNTWGQTDQATRLPDELQWPNILQEQLGIGYRILQEGVGGRVAGNYITDETYMNGQDSFEITFRSANPMDLVIISLGTNDLKTKYRRTARDVVNDLLWYATESAELASKVGVTTPTMLYVAPANFVQTDFEADEVVRQEIIHLMSESIPNVIVLPELQMSSDGIHYSPEAHKVVAEQIYAKVKELRI